jgi:hypothetical protein
MIKTIATFLMGAVGATALVVACSDDSPRDADAATCDCPSAEPPIAGRITPVRGVDSALAANSMGTASATCPANAVLVSGWCELGNSSAQAALVNAGTLPTEPQSWFCQWNNYSAGIGTVHAVAFCLTPPQ